MLGGTDQQKEPYEAVEVGLWSLQRHLDPVPVELLLVNIHVCRPMSIEPHASKRPVLLFVVKKPGRGRRVRHEEVANATKSDRCRTLNYIASANPTIQCSMLTKEDPRPLLIPANLDPAQPASQQPAKRATQRRGAVEQPTPQ